MPQRLYFLDAAYRSLEQLDDALAAGEINPEDYEQLLVRLLDESTERSEESDEPAADELGERAGQQKRSGRLQGSLRSSFAQTLTDNHSQVRFDRVWLKHGGFTLKFATEQRCDRELLLRSRSLQYEFACGSLHVGSFDFKRGVGLTLGSCNFHTDLSCRDDFTSSLLAPVKNRHNGVLMSLKLGKSEFSMIGSVLSGQDVRRTAVAAVLQLGSRGLDAGVILLRQNLRGQNSGGLSDDFIAPFVSWRRGRVKLAGESSITLAGASAHQYSLCWQGTDTKSQITIFSYGAGYRSLQSGGYAYPDYETVTIAALGFSYRDKRRGRIGIASTSRLVIARRSSLSVDFARWSVGVEQRECAAAKACWTQERLVGNRGQLTATVIWENKDLQLECSSRQAVSLAVAFPMARWVTLDSYQKLERRNNCSSSRCRLHARVQAKLQACERAALVLKLDYRDSDLAAAADSYFDFSFGQELSRAGAVSLGTSIRIRYDVGGCRWLLWNFRAHCAIAI